MAKFRLFVIASSSSSPRFFQGKTREKVVFFPLVLPGRNRTIISFFQFFFSLVSTTYYRPATSYSTQRNGIEYRSGPIVSYGTCVFSSMSFHLVVLFFLCLSYLKKGERLDGFVRPHKKLCPWLGSCGNVDAERRRPMPRDRFSLCFSPFKWWADCIG